MNKRIAFASVLIIIGAIFRLIPHPNNFTPVAAMALMGGMYFAKKYLAFLVPVLALLISDFVLNNTINRVFIEDQTGIVFWADFMTYTYFAIILTVMLGFFFMKKSVMHKIVGGSLLSSILFFVITNFGSWMSPSSIYVKDFSGLLTCFAAGIPFFANTLISNTLFIGLFVLAIEGVLQYQRSIVKA